ncbi:MAG: hypothetical protein AB8B83_07470 [Bdellovibrionales bacterium]
MFGLLYGHAFVNAQSIVRVQEMDFGEAAIRRNDTVYDILLTSAGNTSAGSNFNFVSTGRQGIYRLTGAAPSRPITVNVTVDQQMVAAGQAMVIDNFDVDAPTQTDVNGEAVIRIGARIRTNGNGVNYIGNSNFIARMTLSINVL